MEFGDEVSDIKSDIRENDYPQIQGTPSQGHSPLARGHRPRGLWPFLYPHGHPETLQPDGNSMFQATWISAKCLCLSPVVKAQRVVFFHFAAFLSLCSSLCLIILRCL